MASNNFSARLGQIIVSIGISVDVLIRQDSNLHPKVGRAGRKGAYFIVPGDKLKIAPPLPPDLLSVKRLSFLITKEPLL